MALISIVIPMRNAEAWIELTLRSICAQRGVELEIIVINDGSTDRSEAIVEAFNNSRIRVVPGPKKGIAAAFNAGLEAARGDYLARCDADDLYPVDRLKFQVDYLESHPEFGAVCGYFSNIDADGKRISENRVLPDVEDVTDELFAGIGRSHMCAYLFRTHALRQIGGCREWFITSEDADLQFRLAGVTRIAYLAINAYEYRIHASSVTHTRNAAQIAFFEHAASHFLKQRRDGGLDDLQSGRPPLIPAQTTGESHPITDHIQVLLLGKAWALHRAGEKNIAIWHGWRAVKVNPGRLSVWKSFVSLIVK